MDMRQTGDTGHCNAPLETLSIESGCLFGSVTRSDDQRDRRCLDENRLKGDSTFCFCYYGDKRAIQKGVEGGPPRPSGVTRMTAQRSLER